MKLSKIFPLTCILLIAFAGCQQSELPIAPNKATDSISSYYKTLLPSEVTENKSAERINENTMDIQTIQEKINPYFFFYFDDSKVETDKIFGTYINFKDSGFCTIRQGELTLYDRIHPALDLLANGERNFWLYKDEEKVAKAKLIKIPSSTLLDDGWNDPYYEWLAQFDSYALQLEDQSIKLESGYYFAISTKWNAVPRPVVREDPILGSIEVDLAGNGTNDKIMVDLTEDAEWGGFIAKASLNGKYFTDWGRYAAPPVITNKPNAEEEPENYDLHALYDLDGDGVMELVWYAMGDGGSTYVVYTLEKSNFIEKYAYLDEEDLRFPKEPEYGFSYPNRVSTEKSTIQTEQISEGTSENLIPNISQKSEIRTVSLSKANDLAFGLKNTWRTEILGDKVITADDFWHRLYFGFQLFNSSYKETPEDIIIGLKDLSWLNQEDFALFVWDADRLMKDEQEAKEKVLEIIENEVISYWENKDASFSVYLVQD